VGAANRCAVVRTAARSRSGFFWFVLLARVSMVVQLSSAERACPGLCVRGVGGWIVVWLFDGDGDAVAE
jgi:hypothetical protein